MVIFDEYLNKPEKALKEAVEIRKVIGESHPLLDLAESIVWFRLDDYIKTIELIENIEKSLPLNILTFRRLFSLRRGLICAEKISDPEMVKKFATKGYELSIADIQKCLNCLISGLLTRRKSECNIFY